MPSALANQIKSYRTKIKAGREFSVYRVRDSMGNSETEGSPVFGKPVEGRKLMELAYLLVILAVFALAKEFLLPLILAILISFLLAPAVSRLERWRFPGVIAILSVVGIAFALIAGLFSTLSIQGLDLVNSLPKYRDNIHAKWAAIQKGPPGPLNLAFSNVDAMIADLGKVSASAGVNEKQEAMKVQIVSGADSVVAIVKNSLTPVMGPIAEFAVVLVLVVFMLLERKRIRVRFLRLIGHSRVVTTTLAIDEAGSRLSGFLLGQLLVNTGFALLLGLGLFLIGIPNALLWAVLTLPAFHICSVLLAAKPPTSSETKFIRLLTEGRHPEARALLQELGGMQLSVGIIEELILPALRAIENDLYPGAPSPTKSRIYAQLRELIEEMNVEIPTESERPPDQSTSGQPVMAIVPFVGESDEIVGSVIGRLLAAEGIGTVLLPWKTLRAEKVERLKELKAQWILLSAIESRSVSTVGKMAHSIKLEVPDALILVGLWSLPTEGAARWVKRIKESSGSALYTNIEQAIRAITSMVPQVGDELQARVEKQERE